MADFTLTTDIPEASLSEAIAEMILDEDRPGIVMLRHLNAYSNRGFPSKTLRINRWDTPTLPGSGVEGVRFTDITKFTLSKLEMSPSEFSMQATAITNDAVANRLPGFPGDTVAEVMNRGTFNQKMGLLAPEAGLLGRGTAMKAEKNAAALMSTVTRSVGSTAARLSLDYLEEAIAQLEAGTSITGGVDLPHQDICVVIEATGLAHLRRHATGLASVTAVAGDVWSESLADVARIRPELPVNGLKAAALGAPIYVMGNSIAPVGVTSFVGGVFLRGSGAPEQSGQGQPGAFAYLERTLPITTIEGDHRDRGAEIMMSQQGAFAVRRDDWAVKLVYQDAL